MSRNGNDFAWICGLDQNIVHTRFIDNGGAGDVHEMAFIDTGRVFARKVIRIAGQSNRHATENEARVISRFIQEGSDKHIIEFLAHGWLPGEGAVYYIDMELASMTLEQYIKNCRATQPTSQRTSQQSTAINSRFFQNNSTPLERIHNMWTIGLHIALGLHFLHSRRHVHRDLKPSNVLYCQSEDVWKLTDFGITTEATSKAITTQLSRGTSAYRPPEILGEYPQFSNKLDIWALGCILIEIATGSRAFRSDIAVAEHYRASQGPPAYNFSPFDFWNHHLRHFASECLAKSPNTRPVSASACRMLHAYSLLSQPPLEIGVDLFEIIPYKQWKSIVDASTYEAELIYNAINAIPSPWSSIMTGAVTLVDTSHSPRGRMLGRLATLAYETNFFWLNRLHSSRKESSSRSYWWQILLELQNVGRKDEATILFYSILRDFPDRINTGPDLSNMPVLSTERLSTQLWNTLKKTQEWLYLCQPKVRAATYPSIFPSEGKQLDLNRYLQERLQITLRAFYGSFAIPVYVPIVPDKILLPLNRTSSAFFTVPTFDLDLFDLFYIGERADAMKIFRRICYALPFYVRQSKGPPGLGAHYAAWCGNIAALESYKSKQSLGPPKKSKIGDLPTPLHLAVSGEHKKAVEMLLRVDPSAVNASAAVWGDATPLHVTVFSLDPDMLNMLLKAAGNVSRSDFLARTPLHYAAILHNIDALQILIAHGASTIARDKSGYTPAHYTVLNGDIEILEI